MCGIWAYIVSQIEKQGVHKSLNESILYENFMRISHRGPDRSKFINLPKQCISLGFHRLSIMDTSTRGDQPFVIERDNRTIYALCNGEIYNHKYLEDYYGIKTTSGSDCEFIPQLYHQIGMEGLWYALTEGEYVSGEFAIIILDINKDTGDYIVNVARDRFGVRPLYYAKYSNGTYCFSSELMGIPNNHSGITIKEINQFDPGWTSYLFKKDGKMYTDVGIPKLLKYVSQSADLDVAKLVVKQQLELACKDRLTSDRKIGFLLSGGLDSSLVCAISAKYLKEMGVEMQTFSIGLEESTDEYYAKLVADHIDSKHTHVKFTNEQFIEAVDDVVYFIATYDITTVRASVGQYLICKWIAENTDIKVLLIGDGSDELFGGYRYFLKAPNEKEYEEEIIKLLTNIHRFDGQRADRGVARNGLEARLPFLDHRLVDTVMAIHPSLRMPKDGVEKWLLRESFRGTGLLPDEVLFRTKEAFSDGVSTVKKSWYQILQEKYEAEVLPKTAEEDFKHYEHCPPHTKEAMHYRDVFEGHYGAVSQYVIPYFWLPNQSWVGNVTDPSARVLDCYSNEEKTED
uniref:asparagine synthase (glutamine-hydrolyzing) n=1 Tax=viral metagenome TaxID=1070528 RepID=A0A6C0EAQ4_9ZZZZ